MTRVCILLCLELATMIPQRIASLTLMVTTAGHYIRPFANLGPVRSCPRSKYPVVTVVPLLNKNRTAERNEDAHQVRLVLSHCLCNPYTYTLFEAVLTLDLSNRTMGIKEPKDRVPHVLSALYPQSFLDSVDPDDPNGLTHRETQIKVRQVILSSLPTSSLLFLIY